MSIDHVPRIPIFDREEEETVVINALRGREGCICLIFGFVYEVDGALDHFDSAERLDPLLLFKLVDLEAEDAVLVLPFVETCYVVVPLVYADFEAKTLLDAAHYKLIGGCHFVLANA